MVHRQQRRDLSACPTQQAAATDEARSTDGLDENVTEVEATPPSTGEAVTVPRQERRPRRDAYDLYAQIYAIRTEGRTP
jgi:hypothetical protein